MRFCRLCQFWSSLRKRLYAYRCKDNDGDASRSRNLSQNREKLRKCLAYSHQAVNIAPRSRVVLSLYNMPSKGSLDAPQVFDNAT